MSRAEGQLCLPLRLSGDTGFGAFIADGNEEVVATLRQWAITPATGNLLIHGEAASGKSHLLQAAYDAAAGTGAVVHFIALDVADVPPSVLEGLDRCDAVVIDAIHRVAGDQDWEIALFNLYNRLHQQGGRLLLGARTPVPGMGLTLPDLASRLSACATYALRPLDDAGRALLLHQSAVRRGILLDEATIRYILTYCPRDTLALLQLLDDLDRTSLALRRAPNHRLVGDLLRRRSAASQGEPTQEPEHRPT